MVGGLDIWRICANEIALTVSSAAFREVGAGKAISIIANNPPSDNPANGTETRTHQGEGIVGTVSDAGTGATRHSS
jgi:hypothetical protein